MLPTVDFCGFQVTRLVIGANPFGGFSHQSKARDAEMIAYYTVERILETWSRAEAAGINTMVTNNESPHVVEAVRRYLSGGGSLQWIAQVNNYRNPDMRDAIDEVAKMGCKALYFHGARVDQLYADANAETLKEWVGHARSLGVPVGVAAHEPKAHLWVDSLDLVDFHAVPFFNCGSLHAGGGEKFQINDMALAVDCIRKIERPCIGYKIMGAGRIDARMAFDYAFDRIKPGDVVNVGMHRGDKDGMVEEDAAIVAEILAQEAKLGASH